MFQRSKSVFSPARGKGERASDSVTCDDLKNANAFMRFKQVFNKCFTVCKSSANPSLQPRCSPKAQYLFVERKSHDHDHDHISYIVLHVFCLYFCFAYLFAHSDLGLHQRRADATSSHVGGSHLTQFAQLTRLTMPEKKLVLDEPRMA